MSRGAEQLKQGTTPGFAVLGLACTLAFVLAAQDASASEHAAVLELGPSVESELPLSGAHVGPNLAVETTPICTQTRPISRPHLLASCSESTERVAVTGSTRYRNNLRPVHDPGTTVTSVDV